MEKDSEGLRKCFGGFYQAERGLKNFGGAREGTEKTRRGWKGTEKVGGEILGDAVREDSLGLYLTCFEIKNDCQKLSLQKVLSKAV